MKEWNGEEWVEQTRCLSRGDERHDYGRCVKAVGHEDEHEDEEGYIW